MQRLYLYSTEGRKYSQSSIGKICHYYTYRYIFYLSIYQKSPKSTSMKIPTYLDGAQKWNQSIKGGKSRREPVRFGIDGQIQF